MPVTASPAASTSAWWGCCSYSPRSSQESRLGRPSLPASWRQGPAPLSGSLAGSRRRWLLFRMLAIGGLLVLLLGAVAIASDVYQGTYSPTVHVRPAFESYLYPGAIAIFSA